MAHGVRVYASVKCIRYKAGDRQSVLGLLLYPVFRVELGYKKESLVQYFPKDPPPSPQKCHDIMPLGPFRSDIGTNFE